MVFEPFNACLRFFALVSRRKLPLWITVTLRKKFGDVFGF